MSISKSMVEFQSKLKPINKDAENPFFKSSYLSLSGILEATLPILSECGLAITQPMRIDGDLAILQTKITHENGEFILSEMVLPYVADPQKFGSLITYYKRYQLQAMLGICGKEDDDDGNNASYNPNNQHSKNYSTPKPVGPKVVIPPKPYDECDKIIEEIRLLLEAMTSGETTIQKSKALTDICGVGTFSALKLKTIEELKALKNKISEVIKEKSLRGTQKQMDSRPSFKLSE